MIDLETLLARLRVLDEPSRELDAEICRAAGWEVRVFEGVSYYEPVKDYSWQEVPAFTDSLDAAQLLQRGLVWLCPVIDFPERSVRLVNGIGLPVAGEDHRTVGCIMPAILSAAWLKAHVHANR